MALIRRMLQADLPSVLPIDEYVFCTDTWQLYAGTGHGTQQIEVATLAAGADRTKLDGITAGATAVTVATAATLPTSAAFGQMLFTTDTQQFYMGTGTSLVQIGISPAMLEKLDQISQKLTLLLLAIGDIKESSNSNNSVLEKNLQQFLIAENLDS